MGKANLLETLGLCAAAAAVFALSAGLALRQGRRAAEPRPRVVAVRRTGSILDRL